MRWRLVVVATAVLAGAGGLAVWTASESAPGDAAARVLELDRAPFVRQIHATGEIRSSDSVVAGCPAIPRMWNFTLTQLVPEGQQVRQGMPVVAFDAKQLQEELQVKQSELDTSRKELERTRLEEQEKLDQLLLERAELEAKQSRLARKLEVPAELQERLELDKLRLDHTLAREELRLAGLRIEAQRSVLETKIEAAESRVDWLEQEVARYTRNIGRMTVPAARDGFVVHVADWNGQKPKVGDRVWMGRSILEIADLSRMEVAAEVAEPDAGFLAVGQPVEIRLDASPDRLFTGEIVQLGRLFHTRSVDDPSMVFDAVVSIDEPDPELMRPGMAAQVVVLAASDEPTLQLPESAIRVGAEGPTVEVERPGGRTETVAVELGARWDGQVVVNGGLEEGDRVVLEPSGG
jgi:HlyD family secretion protein